MCDMAMEVEKSEENKTGNMKNRYEARKGNSKESLKKVKVWVLVKQALFIEMKASNLKRFIMVNTRIETAKPINGRA